MRCINEKNIYQRHFFAIVTWFAVIATIPIAIVCFVNYANDNTVIIENIIRISIAIFLAVMYIAYQKHAKNIMKGMMGALLFAIVMIAVIAVFEFPENLIFTLIATAMTVVLFVNHFIINSDHHSSPANVLVNQICAIVFAVISCLASIIALPACVNTLDSVITVLCAISQPCAMLGVICIESRLDSYRKDREAAGWTEEMGYPEGYVREHQKKDN